MDNFVPDAFTFKTIIDASPYPVYLCTGEQMIVSYANEATLRTWGKTSQVIGKPFLEAIPEIRDQPFHQLLLDVYHTGVPYYSGDERADLEVGNQLQTFYFKFSYQPFLDPGGKILGVFCSATDVTQLVRKRELLAASEESLKLAIDAAELGTFDYDPANKILYANPRCRELYNITHDNAVTYQEDFLPGLHPDDREWVDKHLRDFAFVKRFSDGNLDIEYRTVGPADRRLRWIKSKGKVFFDNADQPVRFIGTVLDITEQRQAEMRKSDFISIASHELKTPLTTIKAQMQVLTRKVQNEGEKEMAESLMRVNRKIDHMTTLVQNFLDNNRLLEGKLKMEQEVFNFHDLLLDIVDDHRLILVQHKILLEDCEAVYVRADRSKIGQVIENLLSNAAKYSPAGSTITISCKTKEGEVEIGVTDQGIGINGNDQKKLFERFYRVDNERIKNVSGFGIGLYLVAEILRNHHSKIYVESEAGNGAHFYFRLPLVTQDQS